MALETFKRRPETVDGSQMADSEPDRSTLAGRAALVGGALGTLTAFRFLAALAVFLHHSVSYTSPANAHLAGLQRLFWEGWSGVSFFFVLSGFILAYNYAGKMGTRTRQATRSFYTYRFARVWPLHFLTFLLAALVILPVWLHHLAGGSLAAMLQLSLLQAWVPVSDPLNHGQFVAFSFNAPAWTLSCEAFFYLLFPFLLARLVRVKRSAGLALVGLGAWLWVMFLAIELRSSSIGWVLYLFPPIRLVEFVTGICLGLLFLRHRGSVRDAGSARWTAFEVGTLAALGGAVFLSYLVPSTMRYAAYYMPFMVAVIWVFAFERGAISRLINRPALVFLGEISFAFYMLHLLVLRAAGSFGLYDSLPAGVVDVAAITVTVALSAGVFVFFERPVRHGIRTWHLRQTAARPAPAVVLPGDVAVSEAA